MPGILWHQARVRHGGGQGFGQVLQAVRMKAKKWRMDKLVFERLYGTSPMRGAGARIVFVLLFMCLNIYTHNVPFLNKLCKKKLWTFRKHISVFMNIFCCKITSELTRFFLNSTSHELHPFYCYQKSKGWRIFIWLI